MPVNTHATAPLTSAMPTTTNPIPISMPQNPIPMSMPPIPLPQWHSSTAPHFDSQNPSTLVTYLSDYESLAKSAQLTLGEWLAQSTHYLKEKTKMTGKTSLSLMPHSRIRTPLKNLSLGSIRVLGKPSYHQPIWKFLLMRNLSRRSISLTTMPSSIKNLGGWKHIWPKRRYRTSASTSTCFSQYFML